MDLEPLLKIFETAKAHEETYSPFFALNDGTIIVGEYCALNETNQYVLCRTKEKKYYFTSFDSVLYAGLEPKKEGTIIGFQDMGKEVGVRA